MNSHIENVPANPPEKREKISSPKKQQQNRPSAPSIQCTPCNRTFSNNKDYKQHAEAVHLNRKRKTRPKKAIKANTEAVRGAEATKRKDLYERLRNAEEGTELKVLTDYIQPNNQNLIDVFERVQTDLKCIISQKFKHFDVHVYGSAISGLALKDSDFDFFICIKEEYEGDIKNAIRQIYKDFNRFQTFHKVIPILAARTPLIKCTHHKTGFSCDINFTNSRGIYNSKVIRYILQYDPRIFHLTIILKYWAKVYDISGTGKLTNYALTMMTVFFLQNLADPILPPLAEFQADVPEHIIDHWNFAFNFDKKCTTKNQMSITELLREFFNFYESFDFEKHILCPLLGKSLVKEYFTSDKESAIFQRYYDYLKIKHEEQPNHKSNELNIGTSICVQDPFELAHNIASSCGKLNFTKFKMGVEVGVAIFKENDENPQKFSELIIRILTDDIKASDIKSVAKGLFSQTYNPTKIRRFVCKLNILQNEKRFVQRIIDSKIDAAAVCENQGESAQLNQKLMSSAWATHLLVHIPIILKDLFCFKLTEMPQSSIDLKDLRCEGVNIDNTMTKLYELETGINIWQDHTVSSATDPNFLKREAETLREKYVKADIKTVLHFQLLLRFPLNHNFCEFLFLDNMKDGNEMMKFFEYFVSNVRSYLMGYLIQKANEAKMVT